MYTTTWNIAYEVEPDQAEDIGDGSVAITNFKNSFRERIAKDHYFEIAGTDEDHGEHKLITLHGVITTPTAESSKGKFYIKTVGSIGELHYQDTNGNEILFTKEGKVHSVRSFIEDSDEDTSILLEETPDSDTMQFSIGGEKQLSLSNGKLEPETNNDLDIGSSSYRFKDLYLKSNFIHGGVYKTISKSSPSAVSSVTFSGLSSQKLYRLKYELYTSGNYVIGARINSDTGVNYTIAEHNTGYTSGAEYDYPQYFDSNFGYLSWNGINHIGSHTLSGIGNKVISRGQDFTFLEPVSTSLWITSIFGWIYNGASSLSTLTIRSSSGTMTGEIWLEEID